MRNITYYEKNFLDYKNNGVDKKINSSFNISNIILDMQNINNRNRPCDIRKKYLMSRNTWSKIIKIFGTNNYIGISQFDIPDETYFLLENKEWLANEYVNKKRFCKDICSELNIGKDLLKKYLIKHGIATRNSKEMNRIINGNEETFTILNKDQLLLLYYRDKKSVNFIAKKYKISEGSIRRLLNEYEIPIRKNGDWQFIGKERQKKLLDDKEFLIKQHYHLNKSCVIISEELNVSQSTVLRHMDLLGINRRPSLELNNTTSSVHRNKLMPLLEKYDIKHSSSFIIDNNYEIDEHVENNTFLELQGVFFHNYIKNNSKSKTILSAYYRDKNKRKIIEERYPEHKILYLLDIDFNDGLAEHLIKMFKEGKEFPLRLQGYNHLEFLKEVGFRHKKLYHWHKKLHNSEQWYDDLAKYIKSAD